MPKPGDEYECWEGDSLGVWYEEPMTMPNPNDSYWDDEFRLVLRKEDGNEAVVIRIACPEKLYELSKAAHEALAARHERLKNDLEAEKADVENLSAGLEYERDELKRERAEFEDLKKAKGA